MENIPLNSPKRVLLVRRAGYRRFAVSGIGGKGTKA